MNAHSTGSGQAWELYNEAAYLTNKLESALSRSCPFARYMKLRAEDEKRISNILDRAWLRQQRRLRTYQFHLPNPQAPSVQTTPQDLEGEKQQEQRWKD